MLAPVFSIRPTQTRSLLTHEAVEIAWADDGAVVRPSALLPPWATKRPSRLMPMVSPLLALFRRPRLTCVVTRRLLLHIPSAPAGSDLGNLAGIEKAFELAFYRDVAYTGTLVADVGLCHLAEPSVEDRRNRACL